jgi:integrase
MPVDVVIDRYMVQHGSKLASKSTAIVGANLWKQWWVGSTVADMTVARIESFNDWLFDRGYSNNYVRRVLGIGRAALNRAHRRQELASVPFIQLPEKGEPFFHVATIQQIAAFLNALDQAEGYLYTYCMIRVNTGCRGDAARDLQPFQVDYRDSIVRLNPQGRKQTKKYRPVVPLTDTLRAHLERLATETYYVAWNGRHIGSVRKAWAAVRKRAGLPVWFSPKVLRHTVATELRRRGVPGWEVSGLLGHSTSEASRTTEIYAKYDPEFLSKARIAIDAWMKELAALVPAMNCPNTAPTGNSPAGQDVDSDGRGDRIRTCDFYLPKVAGIEQNQQLDGSIAVTLDHAESTGCDSHSPTGAPAKRRHLRGVD